MCISVAGVKMIDSKSEGLQKDFQFKTRLKWRIWKFTLYKSIL